MKINAICKANNYYYNVCENVAISHLSPIRDATVWLQKFLKIPENVEFFCTLSWHYYSFVCIKISWNKYILSKFPEIKKFPEKWHLWPIFLYPFLSFPIHSLNDQIFPFLPPWFVPFNLFYSSVLCVFALPAIAMHCSKSGLTLCMFFFMINKDDIIWSIRSKTSSGACLYSPYFACHV